MLSQDQLAQYERDGFVAPIDIFSAAEIAAIRRDLEDAERDHGDALAGPGRNNAHLALPVLDQISHDDRILDAVEQLIGHDILISSTTLFIKEAQTKGFVSYHQDARYIGMEPHNWVTAWVAISDVNEDNGCMYMLPGSHTLDLMEHDDTYGANNILTRGQTIHGVDEGHVVPVILNAGQLSLHHPCVVHGSGPNLSCHRRIGFAIQSYIGGDVKQVFGHIHAQQARGAKSMIPDLIGRADGVMTDQGKVNMQLANDALAGVFYEGAKKRGKY